jgi:hypothetical protein
MVADVDRQRNGLCSTTTWPILINPGKVAYARAASWQVGLEVALRPPHARLPSQLFGMPENIETVPAFYAIANTSERSMELPFL